MGIPGLLPALKSVIKPIHIRELSGSAVAVDTYSWLHKAAFSCARELCRGIPTSRHIDYCMNRVNLLRHYGVKPILVFDGGILPMKSEQEAKRARSRKENLERAIEHELCGNQSAAFEFYQRAVDITPLIAFQLIEVLRREGVEYVIAPYEADAQMAFLSIKKRVSAVITEDSDLIPFGCSRIIFKLDKEGNGDDFQYAELAYNRGLNFSNFTKEMVLEMCILSGCDYLQSLQGVGIKKAHDLIKRFRSYKKIIKHLKYNGVSVPASYEEDFGNAILTFRHQLVYDHEVENAVHLTELPENLECDVNIFGPPLPKDFAKAIALGEVDPISKEIFQEAVSTSGNQSYKPYEANGVHRERKKRTLELPAEKNVLTNYFCPSTIEAKRQFKAPRIMNDIPQVSTCFVENEENNFEWQFNFENLQQRTFDLGPLEDKFFLGANPAKHMKENYAPDKQDDYKNEENFRSSGFEREEMSSELTLADFPKKATGSNFERTMETSNMAAFTTRKVVHSPFSFMENKDTFGNTDILTSSEDRSQLPQNIDNYSFKSRLRCYEEPSLDRKNDSAKEKGAVKSVKVDDLRNCERKHIPAFKSNLIGKSMGETKFACNLSHLDQYSVIAEKSVDRLASTISSFKYNPAGARASGLRPPMKAPKIQRPLREVGQLPAMDSNFNKFVYRSSSR